MSDTSSCDDEFQIQQADMPKIKPGMFVSGWLVLD